MPRKVSITAYLRPDQLAALKALVKLTGVPQSVYIRDGIDMILKRVK